MQASISVIVPVYNGAQVIPEAIASALEQSHPPDEVIVIDDCSTDRHQLELALGPWLAEKRITLMRTEANTGPAKARNLGIQAAKGELIAFLDADDRFDREHLAVAAAAFARWPETSMTFADALVRRGGVVEPGLKNDRWQPIPEIVSLDHLLEGNCISTLTVVARRSELLRIGLFDETRPFHGVEDYDMWVRMAKDGVVRYLDQPMGTYVRSLGSLSDDPLMLFEGVTTVFEKLVRAGSEIHPRHLASTERRRRQMQIDLAYNLCRRREFARARRAALTAMADQPLTWRPYKLLAKALLRHSK